MMASAGLDPRSQLALAAVLIHLLFLIVYSTIVIWRWSRVCLPSQRPAKTENYCVASGSQRPIISHNCEVGFGYYVAVNCCLYLLGINAVTSAWAIVVTKRMGWFEAAAVVQLVGWCVMAQATNSGKRREKYSSFLRAWWILIFLVSFLSLATDILLVVLKTRILSWDIWLELASFPAIVVLAILAVQGQTGVESVAELGEPLLNGIHEAPEGENITPYSTAGLFSLATVSWVNPLLAVGAQKHLGRKDVPLLAPRDRAKATYATFKAIWDKLKTENPTEAPSIVEALIKSVWKLLTFVGLVEAVNAIASYVGPYLINDFVEYLGGKQRYAYEGYILVFCFFGASIVETLTQRQAFLGNYRLDLKVRASLTAIVFRKGLRLSSESRKNHTTGEIINYMAVDITRIAEFVFWAHDIWILPLKVGLALAILYKVVGLASIAALVATIATIALNMPLISLQERYQVKLMAAKDARMKATSECLRNMRILKLQVWETNYLANIERLRGIEYGWLAKNCYVVAASTFVFWIGPIIVSVVTFGTCILLGEPLTTGRILLAVATFQVLRDPLRYIPDLAAVMAQTKVSLDRLKQYLQEAELPVDSVEREDEMDSDLAVEIEEGEFSWNPFTSERTLSRVNLQIKKGDRVAVCGTVGAGKSSLLACMLGEIPKLAGRVRVRGSTAYVAQSAWIQSGTVEDNIRFGSPMDLARYETVLQVCALKKDLEFFSFGDQTEIGERGINLSGGQKQRVQLARALYQDADIYFLDDPLSAVDAHTGSHLFTECILGALKSKTVVYVTHQMEFLAAADLILVLRDGVIVQAGQYDELLQAGTDFSTLVTAHNDAINTLDMGGHLDEATIDSTTPLAEMTEDNDADANKPLDPTSTNLNMAQLLRKLSSKKETEIVPDKPQQQLVKEEERETGRVSSHLYWSYLTAVANGAFIPVFLLAQISFQVLQILSTYWMAWGTPATPKDLPRVSSNTLILVYSALAFASSFCVLLRSITSSLVGLLTSQKYFLSMIQSLFRAPMSFFDATPTGRILNRMSSDQSTMDLRIHSAMASVVNGSIQFLGIIVVMSQVTWPVLLLVLPIGAACLWMQRIYMASARELARLYSIQKSPIINHYGESITGASTIRGFGQEQRFMATNLQNFDNYGATYFHNTAAREWLILRMEILSLFVFALCLVLVIAMPRNTIDPSMAGLAVTYGLNLNSLLASLVENICGLENTIICVERIQQYCELPSEAPLVIEKSRPSRDWPSHGTIVIRDLQVRYNAHMPMVLHGVTCTFGGGEKVGVVGRTGSGKSTLIQALFRMVEPVGGKIVIDNLDISSIGLHDLRTRLSIIPQDPTLFEGTMRANLDPLEEYSDLEIWEALDKCQLSDVVHAKPMKLNSSVSENGENWSVGQRQLVCLGRALLKRTRILVLDEATASVDSATDGVIQRTLRSEFSSCTVITIAHRIPTVVDSDHVLVLNDGKVSEYDTPLRLLEDKSSLFAKLVAEYLMRSTNSTIANLSAIGSAPAKESQQTL